MTTRELINETKPDYENSTMYFIGTILMCFCLFLVVGLFVIAGLGVISHIAWNLFQIGWNSPLLSLFALFPPVKIPDLFPAP